MAARARKRFIICVLLGLGIGGVFSLALNFGYFSPLNNIQNLVTDAILFRSRDGLTADKVVMMPIDEASVSAFKEQYGRVFSWPRTLHAQALKNLADAGARVVVYDILFDAPGCPATVPRPCPEDKTFADAMDYARQKPGGGVQIILATVGSPPEPSALLPGENIKYQDTIPPIAELSEHASALGHVHPYVDSDGSVRRMPLVATMKGVDVNGLPLQAAASYLRRPKAVDQSGPGYLYFAGRPVPVDNHGLAIVNFLGKPSHLTKEIGPGPVASVSFADVVKGSFDREKVKDKIVFVGLTAIGFADDYFAPTSVSGAKMTGVEIHAQTAEMLLRSAYLAPQTTQSTIAIILGLTLMAGVVLPFFQPVLGSIGILFVFFLYIVANIWHGTEAEGVMGRAETFTVWNNVFPGAALLTAYLGVILYRVVFEQAEARATRGVMGKYLSPAVMTEVLKDPDHLELGGVKRDMTVLFSDIRGFTSVSEKMDPQDLVAFLNEFLTEMTDIVYVQAGVLDKYMGDCIMAFWGAPLVQENHAMLGVRTGYDMVKRLHQLQVIWMARGLPKLNVGVGINSGPMTVGNVGSTMRFDYTVMGDSVNLGSRVEGVNKEYGTNIIVTEYTYAIVKDKWVCRYLDLIAVKGKKEPTAIYEVFHPVGEEPEAALKRPDGFLEGWDEAIRLYRAQDFETAKEHFEALLDLYSDDGPTMVYIERCELMADDPPGEHWDGVFVMTHK